MLDKKIQKSKIFELPMNRKGQGISINVIIIAAIALLVLVILAVLLIRSGGDLVVDCVDTQGTCADTCSDLGGDYIADRSKKCSTEGTICCIPLKR